MKDEVVYADAQRETIDRYYTNQNAETLRVKRQALGIPLEEK